MEKKELLKPEEEIILKNKTSVDENIKLVFSNGLVLIGKYDEKEDKLLDVLQVIITPIPQQTEQVNSLAQQQKIAYQFVPFLMGLAEGEKGIINELSLSTIKGNYLLIEPNTKVKEDYIKLVIALKSGIILDKKPDDILKKENS
jgi:hypothetical protein